MPGSPVHWPPDPTGAAAMARPTAFAETRPCPRAEAPARAAGSPIAEAGVAPLATLLRWLIVGLVAWGALGICDRALTAAGQRAPLPGSPGGYRGASLDRWFQEEQQRRLAEVCEAPRPTEEPRLHADEAGLAARPDGC